MWFRASIILSYVTIVLAVFEDEAGRVDKLRTQIGIPKQVEFHAPADGSGSLCFARTSRNVLAALNCRTGEIIWRRVTDAAFHKFQFLPLDGNIMIVSSMSTVEAWSAQTGHTLWITNTVHDQIIKDVVIDESLPNVYSYTNSRIACHNAFSGELSWTYLIPSESTASILVTADTQFIHITREIDRASKVVKLQTDVLEKASGTLSAQHSNRRLSASMVGDQAHIQPVCKGHASGFLWSHESQGLTFHSMNHQKSLALRTDAPFKSFKVHCTTTQGRTHLVVQFNGAGASSWAEVYTLDLPGNVILDQYHVPSTRSSNVLSLTQTENVVYIVRASADGWIEIWDSRSHGRLEAFQVANGGDAGALSLASAEVIMNKTSGEIMARVMVVVDSTLSLWRGSEQTWTREEGLAHVEKILLVELPDLVASRVVQDHTGHAKNFIRRTTRHLKSIRHAFFRSAPRITKSDQFGLEQYAIAFDGKGNVWAVDTFDLNHIIWTKSNDEMETFVDAWVIPSNASDSAALTGPQVMMSLSTGSGLKYRLFNALTGSSIDLGVKALSEQEPSRMVRANSNYIELIEDLGAETSLWRFLVPNRYRIAAVSAPASSHSIASVGRVLGNRSVLYKYLQGSFFAVAATDELTSTLGIWVLDADSGSVLHHEIHLDVAAGRSVNIMQAENWFVCHYWRAGEINAYEITVTEMYQGMENQRNDDKQDLYTVSQNYILDYEVARMAATTTRQGITSRDIVLATKSGALLTLSRKLLDPRRPDTTKLSAEHKEEMLMPYEPVISIDPKSVLSHKLEILGIDRIVTGPTLLESTSLVCAYGLDIFITRVTPSMPFDILSESFSKGQIGVSLILLCVAIAFTKPMAAKKALDRRWIG